MVNSKKLKTIKTNQKPWKTMKVPWKIMKTKQKLWQTKTSKNIVNDYEVQKIASVAMVTCVQENRYHQALKKKTIAIALPPKFDDRSSLVGTRMLMMTTTIIIFINVRRVGYCWRRTPFSSPSCLDFKLLRSFSQFSTRLLQSTSIPLFLLIKIVITIIMSKLIPASSRPHLIKIVITMIMSIIVQHWQGQVLSSSCQSWPRAGRGGRAHSQLAQVLALHVHNGGAEGCGE